RRSGCRSALAHAVAEIIEGNTHGATQKQDSRSTEAHNGSGAQSGQQAANGEVAVIGASNAQDSIVGTGLDRAGVCVTGFQCSDRVDFFPGALAGAGAVDRVCATTG